MNARVFLSVVVAAALGFVQGQNPSRTRELPALQCYDDAYNRHDARGFANCYTDTIRAYAIIGDSTTPIVWTRSGLPQTYGQIFRSLPRAHIQTVEEMIEGRFVVRRERTTGFPDGLPRIGITVYRLRNGRIQAFWAYSEP